MATEKGVASGSGSAETSAPQLRFSATTSELSLHVPGVASHLQPY